MAINSIIPAKIVEVSQVIDIKERLKKKYLKGAE